MAGDRDLAVSFAVAWAARGTRRRAGWEVTAATGVRGLRLLHEGRAFESFLLTEANDVAAGVLAANAARYPGAVAARHDGRSPPPAGSFDYVDVDPYGSPVPFVEAALAAIRPNGVLAVTATDMMVLAGVQKGACERRYGARPVRGRLGPEGGLRIVLAYLARVARARGRTVRPLLAYVRDHHVRAYLEVAPASPGDSDPVRTVELDRWTGPELGGAGPWGPLWLGPLFDPDLVRAMQVPAAAAVPRATATFLDRLREEVTADVPFYFEANRLAAELALPMPPSLLAMISGLRARGYRAARTHARPEGFRTDAARSVVAELARGLLPPR